MSGSTTNPIIEATGYAPGVDVIVCNYRTPHDLGVFLGSYRDTVRRDDFAHLWVANVCPQEEDRRVLQRFAAGWDEVEGVSFDENVGYNRAVNRAGSRGDREFIAVFNADVELRPGALDDLVQSLRDHPEWGVVGPRQVDRQGLLTAPGIFGTNDNPQWRCWREPGGDGRYSDVRDDCVTVLGSAFVIRRTVWDELTRCYLYREIAPTALGPMLVTFGYWGETYLCTHASFHGWKLAFLGTTTVVHQWHGASGGVVGGNLERNRDVDQAYFRRACAHHGIAHD